MECSLARTYQDLDADGITVVNCHFRDNQCLSLQNGKIIGIDQDKFSCQAEKRTALIHEKGHFTSGAFYLPFSPFQLKEQAEYKADKAAVLEYIPFHELKDLLMAGKHVYEIAEYFNVTEEFIEKAYNVYKNLGYDF